MNNYYFKYYSEQRKLLCPRRQRNRRLLYAFTRFVRGGRGRELIRLPLTATSEEQLISLSPSLSHCSQAVFSNLFLYMPLLLTFLVNYWKFRTGAYSSFRMHKFISIVESYFRFFFLLKRVILDLFANYSLEFSTKTIFPISDKNGSNEILILFVSFFQEKKEKKKDMLINNSSFLFSFLFFL